MFHPGTQLLIDTWASLPEARRIPHRADFDPRLMPQQVPQLFVAERLDEGLRLRLAGAWIERLHGRGLTGAPWLSLWRQDSRLLVHRAVGMAFRDGRPFILTAEMGADRQPLEVAFAPMRGPSGATDRLLGLYQPTTLAGTALKELSELTARLATPADVKPTRAPLMLASLDGRRIAG